MPMKVHAAPLASCFAAALALTAPVAEAVGATVINCNDAGAGSLRVAIASALTGDTVTFDTARMDCSTITLTTGEIAIGRGITIAGPGADRLAVSGNGSSRIFSVAAYYTSAPIRISGLTLTQGAAPLGGAIYIQEAGNVTVADSIISASTATSGGGVFSRAAKLSLDNSLIAGNRAVDTGGGVHSMGSVVMSQDAITENVAGSFGGGIFSSGTVIVFSSTISGNQVPRTTGRHGPRVHGGGGMALAGGSGFVGNSTIYGNYSAGGGAGIAVTDAGAAQNVAFSSLTISGNVSPYENDTGVGITSTVQGSLYMANCIVADNYARSDPGNDLVGLFTATYSLIENPGDAVLGGASRSNLIGIDPDLSALADHGGPTRTLLPAAGSPALDAGDPTLTGTDQRDLPRNANGRADIGAVERQYPEDLILRNGFDPP